MEKIDPNSCNGQQHGVGHTPDEYANVGIALCCGEYVSHASNKRCDVIETAPIVDNSTKIKICHCRADFCPCGDMISHKVSEPCPVIL